MTLGTTSNITPDTPDFAGIPTYSNDTDLVQNCYYVPVTHSKWEFTRRVIHATWIHECECVTDSIQPNHLEHSQSGINTILVYGAIVTSGNHWTGGLTFSPVMGQKPALASVAAITAPLWQSTSIEHIWRHTI